MVNFGNQNYPLSMLQRSHIWKVALIDRFWLYFIEYYIFCPLIEIKESIWTIASWSHMLLIGSFYEIIFGIITIFLSTLRPHKLKFKFFFRISQVCFYFWLLKFYFRLRKWYILDNNGVKSIIIGGQSNIKMPILDFKLPP